MTHVVYLCADPGIPYWGTKGASIHVRSFAAALAAAGHRVTVVIARIGKRIGQLPEGVSVVEIPMEEEGFFLPAPDQSVEHAALLSEARQFAQNRSAQDVINDIVAHEHVSAICERYSLFSMAGRESARWHNLPYLLEVNAPLIEEQRSHRTLVLEPLAQAIARYLFETSDCVIPVSQPLADYVSSLSPGARISVIPNGVNVGSFDMPADGSHWREAHGLLGNGEFLIGFVGSLKPWHGLDILLEAFAMVKAENDMARLVLVGDGPLRASLEEEAERRGLSGHVIFTGGIDHSEVPVAASALDLLVAPYPTMDQFYFSPLKVYEYMAAGKPIVASRIGQISDILEDRRTALLVTPGDASAVATAILRLWADRQFAEQLGHAARLEVQAHHSWSHRIAAWQEQLAKLQECRATEETVT